jgi:hypothetical protein
MNQREALDRHRQSAPEFEPKNTAALVHGGRSAPWRYSERAEQIADALRPVVPAMNESDEVTLGLLSEQLARVETMSDFVARRGVFDARGRVRPVVKVLQTAENAAARLADSLGLNPRARVSLGLGAVQGSALAAYLTDRYGPDVDATAGTQE